VALTSVLAHASIAAHNGQFTMTLDHKSAYLNATMSGPRVGMNLTSDVVDILPSMDDSYAEKPIVSNVDLISSYHKTADCKHPYKAFLNKTVIVPLCV
jgi:hypothetical protein